MNLKRRSRIIKNIKSWRIFKIINVTKFLFLLFFTRGLLEMFWVYIITYAFGASNAPHVHSARAMVDGWHAPKPIVDALPWKRHRRSSCAISLLQRGKASFKGTALTRLKECKDDQYPLYPYFHHPCWLAKYFFASVTDYTTTFKLIRKAY